MVRVFWESATHWRRLSLLRQLGALDTPLARGQLDVLARHRREDGGFARATDEPSSVLPTCEAVLDLLGTGDPAHTQVVGAAVEFLWGLQNDNGGWHESPALPDDRVPFWSSKERGVPILTAKCIEALVEAGHGDDTRVRKAVTWLESMQAPTGMWWSIEGTTPDDTEPDSTQAALSALLRAGISKDSPVVQRACKALEEFALDAAAAWEKTHPPVWPWAAALDGLVAADRGMEDRAVRHAVENILRLRQEEGGWPDKYEFRVVPTFVALGLLTRDAVLTALSAVTGSHMA